MLFSNFLFIYILCDQFKFIKKNECLYIHIKIGMKGGKETVEGSVEGMSNSRVFLSFCHTCPYKAAGIARSGPWKPRASLKNLAEPK